MALTLVIDTGTPEFSEFHPDHGDVLFVCVHRFRVQGYLPVCASHTDRSFVDLAYMPASTWPAYASLPEIPARLCLAMAGKLNDTRQTGQCQEGIRPALARLASKTLLSL